MPPASLSTIAVMKPGPRMAKNTRSRARKRLSIVARSSSTPPQDGDNIVGRDDAGQLALVIDHGKRQQAVLVKQLGDAILRFIHWGLDQRCGSKFPQRSRFRRHK